MTPRVTYRERQVLEAADLRDDHTHQHDLWQRHVETQHGQCEVDGRAYDESLKAELIGNPDGHATIRLGTVDGDSFGRFALDVRERSDTDTERWIAIDAHRNVTVRGPIQIANHKSADETGSDSEARAQREDVRLRIGLAESQTTGKVTSYVARDRTRGRLIEFGPVPEIEGDPVARPWSVYRVRRGQEQSPADTLRVEAFHPGEFGSARDYAVAIGTSGTEESTEKDAEREADKDPYRSLLSVRMDGEVRIAKGLFVTGVLREGPIRADIDDPRFSRALLEMSVGARIGLTPVIKRKPDVDSEPQFSYTVTVKNLGIVDLYGIQLYQSVVRHTDGSDEDGVPIRDLQFLIGGGLNLAVNAEFSDVGHEFFLEEGADPSRHVLAILAMAVLPNGSLVYAVIARRLPEQIESNGGDD